MAAKLVRIHPFFVQFFRFAVVGVGNTAIYYAVYRLILLFTPYLIAHVFGWLVATLFSFLMNCIFVFKVKPTWSRFVQFPAAPLTNLGISSLGSIVLISWLGVPVEWGTLISGIIAIPLTFLTARFVLTNGSHEQVSVGA